MTISHTSTTPNDNQTHHSHAGSSSARTFLLPQRGHLLSLMSILRDASTTRATFSSTTERIADQLISAALDLLPVEELAVTSPTGSTYYGARQTQPLTSVSILRAGASLDNAVRRAYTGPLTFGTILIQRDETTTLPALLYSKLPPQIPSNAVLILEPMLATGGSACCAIDVLKDAGVPEENIIFVNILSARYGLDRLLSTYPGLRVVTAAIDEALTARKEIDPGLGDFGDRFYGTGSKF
ncbi:uracil phosphoribosyltransferase [Aspergillus campestris IBT 28561]|uniref:uracil phosphoribosyltransferase n=1 Tax=Aspergillus campestris (strain IBT 28561) TaxID=1392248 RepID=A0A2I1DE05_ASPC2|nr:uracil phosphoribosyltransferase [Aspergillus campestris IBT 28561]PKY08119.1 uracil phosphoribosyltransferase [Aspergillus campestris IBT 28561]